MKKADKILSYYGITHDAPNGYQLLAKSKKYAVVLMHGSFRVENLKGLYPVEVPYVDVPPELADTYLGYLLGWKDEEKGYKREAKANGTRQFDLECDQMFDDEHTELYPESVN